MKRSTGAKTAALGPPITNSSTPASAIKVQPSSAFTSVPTKKDVDREKQTRNKDKVLEGEAERQRERDAILKEQEKERAKVRLADMLNEDLDLEPALSSEQSNPLQTPNPSMMKQEPESVRDDSPTKEADDGYVRETSIEVNGNFIFVYSHFNFQHS